ncbi:hypothetical protein AB0H83_50720, partial [Dactylosporangium sp. NPDC050688]
MNPHHNSPTTVTRSALRRTSVGIVAAALFAGGALSACKNLPATGSAGRPTTSPAAGTPSSSTSVSPAASASASASASPSKSASTNAKPPAPGGGGGGGVPATYTVAGYPAAHNTGYPQGLPGDTRKKVTLTPYTGPMTITVAGTVIDGKDINGHLEIKAKNVT